MGVFGMVRGLFLGGGVCSSVESSVIGGGSSPDGAGDNPEFDALRS